MIEKIILMTYLTYL